MQNAVTWFEIPANDFKKAVSFYNTVFGLEMFTHEMMGFPTAFFPSDRGAVGGTVIQSVGVSGGCRLS